MCTWLGCFGFLQLPGAFGAVAILVCLLVVVVYGCVWAAIVAMWYARSKKYGEKNVMYDSYAWYNHMLSDSSQIKHMPEVGLPPLDFVVLVLWGSSGLSWEFSCAWYLVVCEELVTCEPVGWEGEAGLAVFVCCRVAAGNTGFRRRRF